LWLQSGLFRRDNLTTGLSCAPPPLSRGYADHPPFPTSRNRDHRTVRGGSLAGALRCRRLAKLALARYAPTRGSNRRGVVVRAVRPRHGTTSDAGRAIKPHLDKRLVLEVIRVAERLGVGSRRVARADEAHERRSNERPGRANGRPR
jgi:hypothetical protein